MPIDAQGQAMNFNMQELNTALQVMRLRPAFAAWPTDLQTVMEDPVRARLVRLEATGQRRKRTNVNTPASNRPARWRGSNRPLPQLDRVDFKSRAAGEQDE